VLEELVDGRLRCPRARHQVKAWVVVDVRTGDVLGAGRVARGGKGKPGAAWLGPRLQRLASLLVDVGDHRLAQAVPARPAAA